MSGRIIQTFTMERYWQTLNGYDGELVIVSQLMRLIPGPSPVRSDCVVQEGEGRNAGRYLKSGWN